jgi:hypothetical protein
MKNLTVKEIEDIKINDIKNMTGEFKFSSYVPMASFIKKLAVAKRSYTADYKLNTVSLN